MNYKNMTDAQVKKLARQLCVHMKNAPYDFKTYLYGLVDMIGDSENQKLPFSSLTVARTFDQVVKILKEK